MAAEGLANVYYPDTLPNGGKHPRRFGYDLMGNAAGNLLRQYWPHINRKLKLVPQQSTPAPIPDPKP